MAQRNEQSTQLTERAVNVEQQVKGEKRRADRTVKKLEETKNALTTVRVRSEDYRRMSTEYAKFQKVTQERDSARQLVSQLTNRAISAEKQAEQARTKSSELLDELKSSVRPVCNSRKHLACHTWTAVANVLNMDATDKKRISKAAKHMHDTLSEDWDQSVEKKTDMSTRLPSAVKLLHKHLFSCVRVNNKQVPINDMIRFVFKIDNGSAALDEIRKAVQAAVAERRLGDAKVLLTLSLSSFKGKGMIQMMKRYFTHVQPVFVGSKVTFLTPDDSPLKKDKKIARRNYSYNSKLVSRGTVVSISADRKKIRIKHHKPGHDEPSITKVSAPHVHHASNIYVNEDLLKSAQQYGKYLGVGVPPVESPSVEYHVISLPVFKHFLSWIFAPQTTNALKARGNDGERGCTHELKDFAARTWKPYREAALKKGLKGISQGDPTSSPHTKHTQQYRHHQQTRHPYT